jgi:cytochrome c
VTRLDAKSLLALAGVLTVSFGSFAGPAAADPVEAGKKLFARCAACHTLEAGKNKVGPSLAGVVGRKAGTAPGYKYSDLNHESGEAGLTWTTETIAAYLPDPTKFLNEYLKANGKADEAQGRSKMTFKMSKPADAEAIAAYLASLPQ